jgi:NAD(P)-dependent dehydrogenase (short-subunit alcohol dehydrogenase family)
MNTTEQPVGIVTGSSSGIGLGITQALLERGWRVVATSRTISKSKDLKPSSNLVLVDGEISKKETAAKVVEAALQHFGRIDLLVNNAGIFKPLPIGYRSFGPAMTRGSGLVFTRPTMDQAQPTGIISAARNPFLMDEQQCQQSEKLS